MSLFLKRTLKAKNNVLSSRQTNNVSLQLFARIFSDDKYNNTDFTSSTILIENKFNVQELPVIVRKLKNVTEIDNVPSTEPPVSTHETLNFNLIQQEFNQCMDLKDVFTLLTKCTKITPNIALGAMERIYVLDKKPCSLDLSSKTMHVNMAKGAILDKLLKVVMKTEDTQTILNALNTVSTFMEPIKYKFCDELMFRVTDNKLSVNHLCEFATYLIRNKADQRYLDTIDKLWVGFVEKEKEINEINLVQMFTMLPGLKASKRTILTLLEHKLVDLWNKVSVTGMQDILRVFVQEKYLTMESFAVVGQWLFTNIHALDEDSLLDIITKLTALKYTDHNIEKAVEKYMKLKGSKIKSQILVVGVLNYCMLFHIRNEQILNTCSEFFLTNGATIPHSFLKFFIVPYGFLYFSPFNGSEFWSLCEKVACNKFNNLSADDTCSIALSFIYAGKYPLKLTSKIFNPEYLAKINGSEVLKKLNLIDTTLSLECERYSGPLLPKNHWTKVILQDHRIQNVVNKIKDSLVFVAGGSDKLSIAVLIPHIYAHETFLIDLMIHPSGLGSDTHNWKVKTVKNENLAILIHLPDHFCSDNEQLVGPQMMRKKHLQLLGFKVVSLKYSVLSQFYTSFNTKGLREYILEKINDARACQ